MRRKDHPRVCGENDTGGARRLREYGSPPRVRGKRKRIRVSRFLRRITPACAGKTDMMKGEGADEEDHPRVCGENGWRGLRV